MESYHPVLPRPRFEPFVPDDICLSDVISPILKIKIIIWEGEVMIRPPETYTMQLHLGRVVRQVHPEVSDLPLLAPPSLCRIALLN